MRLLLGMILGAFLTIGGAYIYDSGQGNTAAGDTTTGSANTLASRPMVNWDVVGVKWHELTEGARHQWNRVTANVQAERAVRQDEPRG
ncbi:MAG: hypothetical protein JSR72_04100 [Proteobacteria bacterium]|nr:hypothetical protein [Pseudomonadota bacterium]